MSARNRKQAAPLKRNIPAGMVLVVLGILLAAAAAIFAARSNPAGSPALSVDREQIDFGEVRFEQPVTATFTLTNTGSAPLKFSSVPRVEIREGC